MEYQLTKLAAIDIGSNAVRCQISAVLFYNGRYRLKRVLDVTGLAPADARQAFTLRVAVVLGRLAGNPG